MVEGRCIESILLSMLKADLCSGQRGDNFFSQATIYCMDYATYFIVEVYFQFLCVNINDWETQLQYRALCDNGNAYKWQNYILLFMNSVSKASL